MSKSRMDNPEIKSILNTRNKTKITKTKNDKYEQHGTHVHEKGKQFIILKRQPPRYS